ncbi:MAG: NAD-binding protein [Halobacteriales archaeon]
MHRLGWVTGRRLAVALPAVVGLLSLVTGVLHLTTTVPIDALRPVIPTVVVDAAGFTGAMTGFLLLLNAYLLRRGFRVGWYGALLLLPLSAVQGLVQASVLSMPLVVLSLAAIPTIAVNRRSFHRALTLDATQIASAISVAGAFAYGTFGTYALRDDFAVVDTVLDAFYYTVITATTVGYGDAVPTTQIARLFSLTVVLFATASFAAALGSLLAPAIEARFTSALGRMTETELQSLEDHVVVVGVGDLTEAILDALKGTADYVVLEDRPEPVARLSARGHRVLEGSGTDEETLKRTQLERARAVVVATNDDARDVLAILTADDVAPDAHIVAAASNVENITKMRNAGADVVISPATIGGRLLVDAAFHHDFDVEAHLRDLVHEHVNEDD